MKKKKKLRLLLGILFVIFIATILFFVFKKDTSKETKVNIQYSSEALAVMKEYNLIDKFKEKEYSKTIDSLLSKKLFKEKYLESYYEIDYQEKDKFEETINIFLDKSYNSSEINDILEYLNDSNIEKLKNNNYIELKDFVKISNVDVDKINRYKDYLKKKPNSLEKIVTFVNIGLDEEFYEEITEIENPDSYTLLLNKFRGLPENYEPNDLTSLSINGNYKLRKQAANAYELLSSAALLDNVKFTPFSAYRSKDYQKKLYNNYVVRDGVKEADTYSARPRHSEHETGLAVDVRSNTLNDNLTPSDYQWMLKNSYKYGFIVRYAKETTPITGYIEEPWHLRYLGIETATDVHNKNITFDEYYDLYLKEA